MSSFIGCKISLISKAGIRYEGILYTIDPRESTVALSKVKSFGTEDRKMDRVIPPRDEIYEYIIFRGSDIQDLNVCEPSKESSLLSEDSAIVRAETSISGNLPPGVMSSGMHHIDNAWPSNNRMQTSEKPIMINNSKSVANSIEVQQNSTAQSTIGSNRFNQISNDNSKKQQQQQFRKNDTQKPDVNNDETRYEYRPKGKMEKPQKYSEKYSSNYHEYDYNYDSNYKYQGNSYRVSCDYGPSRDYYHLKQTGRYRNDYRRDNYYNSMDANKLRGFESSENARDYSYAQYYDYKPRNGHEKYSSNYDNNPKSKKKSSRENETSKKDESFKEDYDFETANAIIAKELAALHVSQEKKDVKDDECEKEDGQLSDNSEAGYYDKTKSFFDNISSEMMDRANGKSVRQLNRKEERKINVETFGMAEANRNLGRNSSKWNRNNRHYSKASRGGGGGSYRGNGGGGTDSYKREPAYKTSSRGGGYNSSRRPVLADGPGRGGDDY